MGNEDWILKGTKLIRNTKKAKIKNLEQRLDSQKYNIKQNKTKLQKLFKKYMKFALKNRVFFFFAR